jgi:H+/Cl- antiporter ClcA
MKGSSTAEGLPLTTGLGPALEAARVHQHARVLEKRTVWITVLSIGLAAMAAVVAQALTRLIGLFTNLAYYGRWSMDFVSPAGNHLGLWAVLVPVLGGVVVGLMARYGSKAIRGHGIPEAMEQVLLNQSRIPPRLAFLKPVSAAIAIGTGGPFGAEGPIIATGGALGSVVGQLHALTAVERKTLLAAGAAAGMTATFGSPFSAVLLAVELLLFELRARSLVPVALAAATAAGLRAVTLGTGPMFPLVDVAPPGGVALLVYLALGAIMGVAGVGVTRAVYAVEDGFARLPVHWMWWPALGGVVVGAVGLVAPRTLGVGYDNIALLLAGGLGGGALATLAGLKLVSWLVALGSGTSGGTLAPLFTIGGGIGALLGGAVARLAPAAHVDVRLAALVGMAAIFAGASRALLASIAFAFEVTLQPGGILPLLGGCTAAYLVSALSMRTTIMTEKIVRRGVRVPAEYVADVLDQVLVRDVATRDVVTLAADRPVADVRRWLASPAAPAHQGFPVVDAHGALVGVVTRRDLHGAADDLAVGRLVSRPPVIAWEDGTLRDAADHMIHENVGRLVVVSRAAPRTVRGIVTRSDLLRAERRRLDEARHVHRVLRFPGGAARGGRGVASS